LHECADGCCCCTVALHFLGQTLKTPVASSSFPMVRTLTLPFQPKTGGWQWNTLTTPCMLHF
jgi:hypothetical protein